MEVEKIFRVIGMVAVEEYKAMECPEYISERQAKKMYGSNLERWVQSEMVTPIQQKANGKRVYEAHRLRALHAYYMHGGEMFTLAEAIRMMEQ